MEDSVALYIVRTPKSMFYVVFYLEQEPLSLTFFKGPTDKSNLLMTSKYDYNAKIASRNMDRGMHSLHIN